MKLKSIIIPFGLASVCCFSFANYTIKYYLEEDNISLVDWTPTKPLYTEWLESGGSFDCTMWTPNENTISIGKSFEQERNCSINEYREKQNISLSSKGVYRDEGVPITETRTLSVVEKNNSIGTLEIWSLTEPNYTEWMNNGDIYDCSNWSPSPDTINIGQTFNQTATNCKQKQNRNMQNIEIEESTGVLRNSGSLIVENRVLTNQTNNRNMIGTKKPKIIPIINIFKVDSRWWKTRCSYVFDVDMSSTNGVNAEIITSYGSYPIGYFDMNGFQIIEYGEIHESRFKAGDWTLKVCSSTNDCVLSKTYVSIARGDCDD